MLPALLGLLSQCMQQVGRALVPHMHRKLVQTPCSGEHVYACVRAREFSAKDGTRVEISSRSWSLRACQWSKILRQSESGSGRCMPGTWRHLPLLTGTTNLWSTPLINSAPRWLPSHHSGRLPVCKIDCKESFFIVQCPWTRQQPHDEPRNDLESQFSRAMIPWPLAGSHVQNSLLRPPSLKPGPGAARPVRGEHRWNRNLWKDQQTIADQTELTSPISLSQ